MDFSPVLKSMTEKSTQGFTRDETIIFNLGEVKSSIESIASKLDKFITDFSERSASLDVRVSSLETSRNKSLGFILACSAVVSLFGTYVLTHFLK
jgi:hypothetical protein